MGLILNLCIGRGFAISFPKRPDEKVQADNKHRNPEEWTDDWDSHQNSSRRTSDAAQKSTDGCHAECAQCDSYTTCNDADNTNSEVGNKAKTCPCHGT